MKFWKLLSLLAALGLLLLAVLPTEGQERGRRRKGARAATPKETETKKPVQASPWLPEEMAQRIDEQINQRLAAEKIPASPRCDDAEFVRRVYLDLLGVIPPPEKVTAFLASKEADKRAKLIDELLTSSRFGDHMADIWTRLIIPKDSNNRFLKPEALHGWLAKNFNANKPWDRLVTELLTASGDVEENGAVTYFLANGTVDKMTDLTSRLFMGVQLQCAQCHNHPFVPDWKQEDYWGMTAFFLKVQSTNPKAAKKGGNLAVNENGNPRGNRRNLPEAAKILPPKFFLGDKPDVSGNAPLRPVLAKWLTAPENPYFSQAMVNRTWAHFFGRGIVNPIDDFQDKNKPSHPELLQALSHQFTVNNYDLKYLMKAICLTDAYQRSSRPLEGNKEDIALFSHMNIKNLTPSQLFDSLEQVLGHDDTQEVRRARKQQQMQRGPRSPRDVFIAFFQTDDGADPLEYQAGIPQALRLMNAQARNSTAVINRLTKPGDAPDKAIERLFLLTLSRKPTPQEADKLLAIATKNRSELRKVYEDILWALLNSSEFAMNH